MVGRADSFDLFSSRTGMSRTKFMVCEATRLQTIIDVGIHPFADTFVAPGVGERGGLAKLSQP